VSAIAVPKFADLITKSQESSLKGSVGSIRSALVLYYSAAEGLYPANLTDMSTGNERFLDNVPMGTVPAVAKQTNPGHEPTDEIILGDGTTADDEAGGEVWYYVTSGLNAGSVFINCTHKDSAGIVWTQN
jgi:hypothetical protein